MRRRLTHYEEPEGHHVAVLQRTDDEIPMGLCNQGACAPRVDEEYVEPEILPVASLPGPREPSKDMIEKHNLLHDLAMPWYDICISSKSRDDLRRRAGPKVFPVIQFDYAVASTQQGQPHFDFMVGTDMSTGAFWSSAVLVRGKEDPYIVSSILSWLSEFGHSKVIIQSDGESTSEVVMRMVQSKSAMMENPPCEIIQRQSQRYSHRSNGDAERMVQTIHNQIKAYTNSSLRRTQESPSKMTALDAPGYRDTQHDNTRDSTSDKVQQRQHTRRSDTCLTKVPLHLSQKQPQADDQEHWSTDPSQHGSKAFGSDVTAKRMNIWSEHRMAWFTALRWSAEGKDGVGTSTSWTRSCGICGIRLYGRKTFESL